MKTKLKRICFIAISIILTFNCYSQANNYDAKTKLKFGISNDSSNVYITLESYDVDTQFQIFRAGMKVSLKMAVEPKNTVSMNLLPIRIDNLEQFQEGDTYTFLKEKVLLNNPTIEISGLIPDKETQTMSNATTSPTHYSISWNAENILTLSFQIKLSDLINTTESRKDMSKQTNLLIVNINGIERSVTVSPKTEQRPTSLSQGGFGREGLNPQRQFGTSFDDSYQTIISETKSFRYKFKLIE